MNCPKCGIELNCGCDSCKIHSPDLPNKMIRFGPGDGNSWDEQCPWCGFTQDVNKWGDVEFDQWEEREREG